jgi:hypothetical protein
MKQAVFMDTAFLLAVTFQTGIMKQRRNVIGNMP